MTNGHATSFVAPVMDRARRDSLTSRTAGRWATLGEPALGIDIGGTKVVAALVASNGKVPRRGRRQEHADAAPRRVLEAVLRAVDDCLGEGRGAPTLVGVSVAAQVDPASGLVRYAPNLRWRDVPLGRRLAKELGRPVAVVNDARAATLAEWRHGAGRGCSDFFCVVAGTGIGGSAVVGGRLLAGGSNALGEIGHLTLVAGGRPCHCPNRGCLEAYAGGWAIAERAREAVRRWPRRGRPLLRRAGSAASITAALVFQMADDGDPLATELAQATEGYLADGLVGIVNAFNPARLALAGGLVAGRPGLVRAVRAAVRARCQPPAAQAKVVAARLGEDAPVIGAATFARWQGAQAAAAPGP